MLYIGEAILSTILTVLTIGARVQRGGLAITTTQWYQYLPFSIGDSVLAPPRRRSPADLSDALLRRCRSSRRSPATAIYLVLAIAIAALVTKRAEIRG